MSEPINSFSTLAERPVSERPGPAFAADTKGVSIAWNVTEAFRVMAALKLLDDLAAIGGELLTQDNAITNEPVFCVQNRVRIYCIDPNRADGGTAWISDDGRVADEETAARLTNEGPRPGWELWGYIDTWDFERAFFTRAAAERYIASNRHNLTEPRVYVHTGYRNQEWIALRAAMKKLATLTTTEGA